MRRWLIIAIAAITPRAAHAGGAVEELAAGATPKTEIAPGSRWLSNKLAGIWDADERWQLRLDLSSTRVYIDDTDATPSNVYLGSLSAVYSPDEHWSLRLSGGWTPASTTQGAVSPKAPEVLSGAIPADAQVLTTSSSCTLGAGIDYDSAANDLHSLSASLSIGMVRFRAQQVLISIQGPGAAGLRVSCQVQGGCSEAVPEAAPDTLSQSVPLDQYALGASVADTIDGDTDLSLDASYYMYDHDPLQFDYSALAKLTASTYGSASGAPVLRDSFTPSVAHRWERIAATLSLSYTDYVDGHEFDVGASLRVQYKVALAGSQRLKIYAKLAAGSHIDEDYQPTRSGSVGSHMENNYQLTRSGSAGLGAQYTW